MIKFLQSAIILTILLSCGNNDKNIVQSNFQTGSKVIDYISDSVAENAGKGPYLQHLGKVMGLPKMTSTDPSLTVRIWLRDYDSSYVLNITSGSQSNIYVAKFHGLRGDPGQIVIDSEWTHLTPKSGWESFFSTMTKYQISEMKSNEEVNDLAMFTHAPYIEFQVCKNNNCRFYESLLPSYFRYVNKSSNNIYQFLHYFNRETGVKVYNPIEHLFLKPGG